MNPMNEAFKQAWLKACVVCMSFEEKALVFDYGNKKYDYRRYWLGYGKEEYGQLYMLSMDELLASLVCEWQEMRKVDQRHWLQIHFFKRGTKRGGVMYQHLLKLFEESLSEGVVEG